MLDDIKPTTVGELKLSDLPPIEELNISVPTKDLIRLGRVSSIVDVLVVIESIKSMPPLDLDTILFKLDGQPVGQIFDVFGAITEPHYAIRFTNKEQILEKNIEPGLDIYFLPQTDRKITKFAFVDEIKKLKGTDASGENDNEVAGSSSDDDDDGSGGGIGHFSGGVREEVRRTRRQL